MDQLTKKDSRTGAHTDDPAHPGGPRIYWHASLSECRQPDCPERHITRAELWPWGDEEDVR